MATSVTNFAATIPAGTPANALATVNLAVGSNVVEKIRWRVPPGPRGFMGWCLSMGGVQVLPDDQGTFIIADDEYDELQISGLPDSGAWQLQGYNAGTFNHTVYLGFYTTPIALANQVVEVTSTGFPQSEADIPTMWLT